MFQIEEVDVSDLLEDNGARCNPRRLRLEILDRRGIGRLLGIGGSPQAASFG